MVDADLLADFDLESGSEKDFFMEQLRIAPPEEVDMLLSSLKRTAKPITAASAPTPANKTDQATHSLLKLEIADFAQKRAAAIPEGVLTKEQLDNFKEEVYMYGIGLNLGETQALLAAAKAKADFVKSRPLKTMEGQLALPQPPIEAINKTIEHFTKIHDCVGEMIKDVPQSQVQAKAATGNTPTAKKRKRSRPSKGGAEAAKASASTASVAEASSKRLKTSPVIAVQAASVVTAEPAIAETDAPKLTRKQKQELYRQELENKRPVIASKIVPAIASTVPTPPKPVDTTAVVPTSAPAPAQSLTAPSQSAQKTRQRARKSAAQKQLEKAAEPVVKAPDPVADSTGPKAPDAAADGFVDLRAPKKKRRGRKSTGTSEVVAEKDLVPEAASMAATAPEKEVVVADKTAAAPSDPGSSVVAVQNATGEGDKDKNQSKRQNKINKRKSLVNEPVRAAVAASTAVATPSKPVQAAAQADKAAAVKQTPIPPPSRAILPPKQSSAKPSSMKAAPAKTATPAPSILPPSTTPILPPSSVSKLVLKKSPAVIATSAPILPGSTQKSAPSTPLAGISAPNSSSKGRKRGPRKSDVAAVANADEPKENHS